MDRSLPSYEAAMRDARAYLRRRDLSSQDEIPLYFAWQRLYAAANANLSTDFLRETRAELDARHQARLPPRRGIPPPLFTSFDKVHRTSAQASAFLRSGTSSDVAIEMMARRYRREAEKLRSSREKLVGALDDAENRLKKNKRRQKTPEQEVEEELQGAFERRSFSPDSNDLLSGKAMKSKLVGASGDAGKRRKKSNWRQKTPDEESDDEHSRILPGSKTRGSTTGKLGFAGSKYGFGDGDLGADGDPAKAAELRRSSLSNPATMPSFSTAENVAAFAARVSDWRMPPDIDNLSPLSGLLQKGAAMYSTASGKHLSGANELRESVLVEGEEGDMTFDTSLESSGLEEDSFDPDTSLDVAAVSASLTGRRRTKSDGHMEGVEDKSTTNREQKLANSEELAEIGHDPSSFASEPDASSINAQQQTSSNNGDAVRGSEFHQKLLQLSHAVGDMQVKIQGKQIEVTFKGELDSDTNKDDSKRDGKTVVPPLRSTKIKQPPAVEKVFRTTGSESRESRESRESDGDEEQQGSINHRAQSGNHAKGVALPRKQSNVRFANAASSDRNDNYNEDQHSSDQQSSQNESELVGSRSAAAAISPVVQDVPPLPIRSGNTRGNLSKRTATAAESILEQDHSEEAEDGGILQEQSRSSKPQPPRMGGDGVHVHSGEGHLNVSKRTATAAESDLQEDHSEETAPRDRRHSSKPQQHQMDRTEVHERSDEDLRNVSKRTTTAAEYDLDNDHNEAIEDAGITRERSRSSKSQQHRMGGNGVHERSDEEHRNVLKRTAKAIGSVLEKNHNEETKDVSEIPREDHRSNKAQQHKINNAGVHEHNDEGRLNISKRAAMTTESVLGKDNSEETEDEEIPREHRRSNKAPQHRIGGDNVHERRDEGQLNVSKRTATTVESALQEDQSEGTDPRGRRHSNKPQQHRVDGDGVHESSDEEHLDEGDFRSSANSTSNRAELRDAALMNENADSLGGQQRSDAQGRQKQLKQHEDSVHNATDDFQDVHAGRKSEIRRERSHSSGRGNLQYVAAVDDPGSEESEESEERNSLEQGSRLRREKQQSSCRLSRRSIDGTSAIRERHSSSIKQESSAAQPPKDIDFDTQSFSDASEGSTNDDHEKNSSDEVFVPREERSYRSSSERNKNVPPKASSRERRIKDAPESQHEDYDRKRQQPSRRSRNQREVATRSDLDSDEDEFSAGPDTPDIKRRHHRKYADTKRSRVAGDVHNYEAQTHIRRLSSRLNSARHDGKRSSNSLDTGSGSDDESLSDYDSREKARGSDRRHRSHKADRGQPRHSARNLEYQPRSTKYSTSRDRNLSPSMASPPKKSKLGGRPERDSKTRSEVRSKGSTKRSHKLPVWPPGMEAECIARLSLDGHHPIAPPGLEHLVTEEQWGDYWTWLHWYSSWQMWYMKNGKKPKCKAEKEKRSGRRHADAEESRDTEAEKYDKHSLRNSNWWVDVGSRKHQHRRDRYD